MQRCAVAEFPPAETRKGGIRRGQLVEGLGGMVVCCDLEEAREAARPLQLRHATDRRERRADALHTAFEVDHGAIPLYLAVSGILFAIGLAGVLLRRSPLTILLSLEIMLNSVNLTLVAFSRQIGGSDGQVFALVVIGIAAAEVVIGLGLVIAMTRRQMVLDTDELRTLSG